MCENRAVRKLLGKETGENWLEKLHDLYFSSSIIHVIKCRRCICGNVTHMGNIKNECRVLIRKPEGRKPL